MAKQDLPPLGPVPKKRRQLEAALDVHLPMWLALDSLSPSERRRVQEERERRRRARREGPPVVLGFSGPREGLTPAQVRTVERIATELAPAEARHGDCVGGDETFHKIAKRLGTRTVAHPADMPRWRAYCDADVVLAPAPPLERNKEIVRASTVLVAAPKEAREPADPRGHGTWYTARLAHKRGKPVILVRPDGSESSYESATIATP